MFYYLVRFCTQHRRKPLTVLQYSDEYHNFNKSAVSVEYSDVAKFKFKPINIVLYVKFMQPRQVVTYTGMAENS